MSDPASPSRLPVPFHPGGEPRDDEPPSRAANASADPSFTAQAIGQDGQKRGLKGGAPVLDAARKSYLHTQWSGPGDRRTPAGVIRKDEV